MDAVCARVASMLGGEHGDGDGDRGGGR